MVKWTGELRYRYWSNRNNDRNYNRNKDNIDQLQLRLYPTAEVNKNWLVPKKTEVLPYIKQGLDIGLRHGVSCYTEAIPFCLMQGYEQCVAEQIIPEGPIFDGNVHLENYADYRRDIGKVKAESCKKCKYYDRCEGPWREYPELYGWDEFKPVL